MHDTSVSGREAIVSYLESELIGPAGGSVEIVADPPHRRYIMGTLYPQRMMTDELSNPEQQGSEIGSAGEELADDAIRLANEWMPSSIGMTFFLLSGDSFTCEVWGARYEAFTEDRQRRWRRSPVAERDEPVIEELERPAGGGLGAKQPVLDGRAFLRAFWRDLPGGYLVTVTLVNALQADENQDMDPETTLHQVGFRCRTADVGFGEYPKVDALSVDSEDEELRVLYRDSKTFAVGHGCAVEWEPGEAERVNALETEFMPRSIVPEMSVGEGGEVLSLRLLSDTTLGANDLAEELEVFVERYEEWISELPNSNADIPERHAAAVERLLERPKHAASRMRKGVERLRNDDQALTAFRLANLAMLMQMRHGEKDLAGSPHRRNEVEVPDFDFEELEYSWYPFQLAFQLLALESLANEQSEDRNVVDLLWFPTGGGKTEAYLALAAFEIFLRRLRHGDRGAGTAVITRYTLRLLTAQQFDRAAAMICAAEIIRRSREAELGSRPFTIGLWVGDEAAPNTVAKAQEWYEELLDEERPSGRFQLQRCPWCGTSLTPDVQQEDLDYYGFRPEPKRLKLFCPTTDCAFHEELPVAVVDEELYADPPTVLIATVDKFARLAWVSDAGTFFGGDRFNPPSLIIQDEMHLLSGPLGTTVGLYEAAIEALIALNGPPAKVIASTATIRNAGDQAKGLFGRPVELFPPSGLKSDNSFFAKSDPKLPGRLYLGVMAPSHTISFAVVHTAAALLQAPAEVPLGDQERDSYGTLIAYHNSMRELGRNITLARDDIPARIKAIASDEATMRRLLDESVVELTSNVAGSEIKGILERMEVAGPEPDSIALLASTNMLSVGVDVPRLALMLMNGQPKTTSEYIQASSRVGRSSVPGLVVTLFAATKPRDRSHYESFQPYHGALYRYVEPTSVTPFSPPSRNRALHAALVILIRHGAGLSADNAAGEFRADDPQVGRAVEALKVRVALADPEEVESTLQQLDRLIEEWERRAEEARHNGRELFFAPTGKQHSALLKNFGAIGPGWETAHQMRNVDRQCTIDVLGTS